MNGNSNFLDHRYLDMHRNMFHNMLVHRNRLNVMMMNVVRMHIIWNMNDNVFAVNKMRTKKKKNKIAKKSSQSINKGE